VTTAPQTAFDTALLIAPAAALVGVGFSQLITLFTDWRRRNSEHLKDARESAETLLKEFQEYRQFLRLPGGYDYENPGVAEAVAWEGKSSTATGAAAMLTGKRGHRQVLRTFIDGLDAGEQLIGDGYGLGSNAHSHFYISSNMSFETIAAWLRYERVPRRARRLARQLRRDLYWYNLEQRSRYELERGREETQSGLVRQIWRKSVRWVRDDTAADRKHFKKAWGDLFRP
jgi:hypothetical protein